jgi:hypothetical protein
MSQHFIDPEGPFPTCGKQEATVGCSIAQRKILQIHTVADLFKM